MKHTLKQWICHLRKMAQILAKEIKLLFERVEWDDEDLPPT